MTATRCRGARDFKATCITCISAHAEQCSSVVAPLYLWLGDLDRFIHDEAAPTLPPLVKIALIHAQFETIHPFLDGNGRIGRLLIAALLEHWGLLLELLMYLSGYLKQHQTQCYGRLSGIRSDGDWEGWLAFSLEGVASAANDAEGSIVAVACLVTADRHRLLESATAGWRLIAFSRCCQ